MKAEVVYVGNPVSGLVQIKAQSTRGEMVHGSCDRRWMHVSPGKVSFPETVF